MRAELQAVELRVLARRPNGGATVELPVLRVATIDRGRTSGGGEGELSIGREDLRRIAENFDSDRPVPLGFDEHKDYGERNGPSEAFVRSLRVDGDFLIATVDLAPLAAAVVVDNEGYRGFSVEMALDRETPTGKLDGWSLHGGIFTNRPAVPIHFAPPMEVAAGVAATVAFSVGPAEGQKETVMSQTVSLEALQAEKDTLAKKVANLDDRLADSRKEADAIREETAQLRKTNERLADELRASQAIAKAKGSAATELEDRCDKLERQVAELKTKQIASETAIRDREITDLVLGAIRDGVDPKNFDGYKENPSEWLSENFGKLPALKKFVAALPKRKTSDTVPSGSAPEADKEEAGVELNDEQKQTFKRLGLKGTFVGAMTEEEARKRFEAAQAATDKE